MIDKIVTSGWFWFGIGVVCGVLLGIYIDRTK